MSRILTNSKDDDLKFNYTVESTVNNGEVFPLSHLVTPEQFADLVFPEKKYILTIESTPLPFLVFDNGPFFTSPLIAGAEILEKDLNKYRMIFQTSDNIPSSGLSFSQLLAMQSITVQYIPSVYPKDTINKLTVLLLLGSIS